MPTTTASGTLEALYRASATTIDLVNVPTVNVLAVDGDGDPNTAPAYREALEALYALSYTLKFALKKTLGIEFKVSPLEGLWWADDPKQFFLDQRDGWHWTMFIVQPEAITQALINLALEEVRHKKNPPALERVYFWRFHEGPSAQLLHIGPYRTESADIARLHTFIRDRGLSLRGKHHEIYLGDPRRTAPEKLRTILRQPVGNR
jgi:hypothetical protein